MKKNIFFSAILFGFMTIVLPPRPATVVDEKQLLCMAKNIYFEARSLRKEEKLAVAHVVLNRVASGGYPDTVCGVVFQNSKSRYPQFSWTNKKSFSIHEPEAFAKSLFVAKEVLEGKTSDPTNGATHYYSFKILKKPPHWAHNGYDKRKLQDHVYMKVRN